MKKSFLFFIISFLVGPLLAHEFWLQPEKFMYQPGENINTRFWVGEDFDGSNWGGNRAKVKSLQLYLNNIIDDLAGHVSEAAGDSLQLTISDEGTPMITFNSTNSFIQLDAVKFNAYLKEDGLTAAMAYRIAHHETDSSGREVYQRSVKTLLQVGDKKSNVSKATNLPLDIIPLLNPYTLKDNDSLAVKLLFRNRPLTKHLVNVWHRINGKTTRQQYQTDELGKLRFPVATSGKWMVSAVNMMRLLNEPKADWQSIWGSCTWGYE
ncbi:MAG: DUF4198 domain-containing protein [Chitinophagaceae bacterium]